MTEKNPLVDYEFATRIADAELGTKEVTITVRHKHQADKTFNILFNFALEDFELYKDSLLPLLYAMAKAHLVEKGIKNSMGANIYFAGYEKDLIKLFIDELEAKEVFKKPTLIQKITKKAPAKKKK